MNDLPQYQYILYSVLSTTEFVIGTPLNLFVFVYFFSKKDRSNSRFLNLCINTVDVIICGLSFFNALSSFYSGSPVLFNSGFLCTVHGMLWNIAPRLSVYLMVVLNISRTVSLIYPLRRISWKEILIPVLIYSLIQIVQATIPFWFGAKYKFDNYVLGCGWLFTDTSLSWVAIQVLYVILVPVEFILPAILVVFSCALSCFQLWAKNPQLGNNGMSNRKKQATITIIILTFTYLIFNLPYCVLVLAYAIAVLSGTNYMAKMNLTLHQEVLVNNLTFTHTVNLNSMVNAIIYLARIQDLKAFGRRAISRISKKDATSRQETSLQQITGGTATEATLDRLDGVAGKRAESAATVYENKTVSRVRNDTEHSSYESEDSACYRRVRADNASPRPFSRIRTSSEGSRGMRRNESESEGRLSVQSPELGSKHFVVIPRKSASHYNL